MLLNFRVNNFKSFKNGFDLSLRPCAIQDLKESILINESLSGKPIKALPTSVIYGPNAAGKTSVLLSMSYFQKIIRNGGISGNENNLLQNNNTLIFVPFIFNNEANPIEFEIEFEEEKNIYKYSLSFVIGKFAEMNSDKKIINEYLEINGKPIFKRFENDISIDYKKINKSELNDGFDIKIFDNYLNILFFLRYLMFLNILFHMYIQF